MRNILVTILLAAVSLSSNAQNAALRKEADNAADKIEQKVIGWRRDIHEHPELGNHEVRTAALIAKHLQSLGIEVKVRLVAHELSK
ncbi:hypothetical protein BH11BAC5_BH11BAC5_54190 [soil metagenome]